MKQLKRYLTVALFVVLAISMVACGQTKSAIQAMDGKTLDGIQSDNKAKENYFVIDVRTAEEYAAGHIRHAVNIPVENIEEQIDLIKGRKEEIVVYCNTGKKSQKAAEILEKAGIKSIYNAAGVKDYQYENIVTYTNVLAADIIAAANSGEATIIDARDKEDYDKGHLPGAIFMSADEIDLSKVPEGKPVYTYCYSGNRSGKIAQALAEAGYENVFNAIDGTKEDDSYTLTEK